MAENAKQIPELNLEELDKLTADMAPAGADFSQIENIELTTNDLNVDTASLDQLSQNFEDPLTGSEKPIELGISPETAVNKSPLSVEDRLKLSVGNKQGKLSYLKSKFEDAEVNKFGDFAVKVNDVWHKVDQDGFQIDDWTNTKQLQAAAKELAKDMADILPEITALTAGAGTAILTGGASIPLLMGAEAAAGGALSASRTSLGRLVGTYEASAEEQAKDIAFEGLLSMVGVGVAAGVKPGAKFMVNKIPVISKGMRKAFEMPEAAGKGMAKYFSRFSVGEEALDVMMKKPAALKSTMLKAQAQANASGGGKAAYHQAIQSSQLADITKLAKEADNLKSKLYQSFESKILNQVDDSFVNPTARSAQSAAIDSVQAGFTSVQKRIKGPGGKAMWQTMTKEGAVEELLKAAKANKPLDPKLFNFTAPSAARLNALVRAGDESAAESGITELAGKGELLDRLKEFNQALFNNASQQAKTGKAAVKLAMRQRRSTKNSLEDIARAMEARNAKSAAKTIRSTSSRFQNAVDNSLDEIGTGGLYSEMNRKYSYLADNLEPLSEMNSTSAYKNLKKAQTFLGRINNLSNSGITARQGLDDAISMADEIDKGVAIRLRAFKESVEIKQAALAWNPVVKGAGTDVGIGTYAIASQNPALLSALGATKLAANRTALKGGVKTSQFLWKQLNFLRGLPGGAMDDFLSDPQAVGAVMLGGTNLLATDEDLAQDILPKIPLRSNAK